ncbi:RNA-binding S4 domain-containing protein [Dialister sp.]|uniref:RNA-binding S4 domain-containing protein n=1 Tax=Dialister sp. TaxID=1955814 RepID=UPI003F0FA62F
MKETAIYGDYIQLDQFLKKMDYISSGGETGAFLENHTITLNGNRVHEKRKKIRKGDILSIDGEEFRMTGE